MRSLFPQSLSMPAVSTSRTVSGFIATDLSAWRVYDEADCAGPVVSDETDGRVQAAAAILEFFNFNTQDRCTAGDCTCSDNVNGYRIRLLSWTPERMLLPLFSDASAETPSSTAVLSPYGAFCRSSFPDLPVDAGEAVSVDDCWAKCQGVSDDPDHDGFSQHGFKAAEWREKTAVNGDVRNQTKCYCHYTCQEFSCDSLSGRSELLIDKSDYDVGDSAPAPEAPPAVAGWSRVAGSNLHCTNHQTILGIEGGNPVAGADTLELCTATCAANPDCVMVQFGYNDAGSAQCTLWSGCCEIGEDFCCGNIAQYVPNGNACGLDVVATDECSAPPAGFAAGQIAHTSAGGGLCRRANENGEVDLDHYVEPETDEQYPEHQGWWQGTSTSSYEMCWRLCQGYDENTYIMAEWTPSPPEYEWGECRCFEDGNQCQDSFACPAWSRGEVYTVFSTNLFGAVYPQVRQNALPPNHLGHRFVAKVDSAPCQCAGSGWGVHSCGDLCCESSPYTSTDPDNQYYYLSNGGTLDSLRFAAKYSAVPRPEVARSSTV